MFYMRWQDMVAEVNKGYYDQDEAIKFIQDLNTCGSETTVNLQNRLKALSQDERQFVKCALKAAKSGSLYTNFFRFSEKNVRAQNVLSSLNIHERFYVIIQKVNGTEYKVRRHSSFFSFFKGIGNLLSWRISSQSLVNKISKIS